jgi:hypothetical protein
MFNSANLISRDELRKRARRKSDKSASVRAVRGSECDKGRASVRAREEANVKPTLKAAALTVGFAFCTAAYASDSSVAISQDKNMATLRRQ